MSIRKFICIMALTAVFMPTCHARAAGTILVCAAASMSDAFRDAGGRFESENPDIRVEYNFAASGSLMRQMELGAPVDVFVSADRRTMDKAVKKGLVAGQTVKQFASNSLVLVVPGGSATGLGGLRGLVSEKVRWVAVGNPLTVPAGSYARDALTAAGIWDALAQKLVLAENVRQVLDYVRRGEVDAGVVYATDAAAAKGQVRVAATIETATPVSYSAAAAQGAPNRRDAERFVAYLAGEKAAVILGKYGFGRAGE